MPAVLFRARRDGYATVSALVISLALAMVAAASMAVSTAELRAARADYQRVRREAALDGAHLRAASEIAVSPGANRLAWSMSSEEGPIAILAENEAVKAPLDRAGELLSDQTLRRLGAEPSGALRLFQAAARTRETARDQLIRAPFGPVWRACILSMVSPVGHAERLEVVEPQTPGAGRATWRTGQVWRIRARMSDGWTDDRLVRWTGNGEAPTAVIERAFYREGAQEVRCDALDD